jgi:flagellar motor switch/type III secretory pathway protein FliN
MNDAALMDRQVAEPPARTAATPRHAPLDASPLLRTLSAAQAGWIDALAGSTDLRRIAANRWPEAAHWPFVRIDLAGCVMTLRLAPHAQWAELGEAASAGLGEELRHAIAAHLTQGLRQSLSEAAHQAGLIAEGGIVPLHEGDWHTDDDDSAALLLALAVPSESDAGLPPAVAWLRVPAHVAPPHLIGPPGADSGSGFDPVLPMRLVLAEAPRVGVAALAGLLPGSVVLLDRIDGGRDGDGDTDADVDPDNRTDTFGLQARLVVCDSTIGCARFGDWGASSLGDAAATGPAATPRLSFMHWTSAFSRTETTRSHTMNDLSEPESQTLANALAEARTSVEAVIDLPPMRLSELQTWAPGVVLRTQADIAGSHVLLRVAGKTVGRGRLIAIDSLLGLELTELFD